MNCPNCGKEIDNNQKFCTNCGVKINCEDKACKTENKFNKLKKIKFVLLILSFILILGIIVCFVFKKTITISNIDKSMPSNSSSMSGYNQLQDKYNLTPSNQVFAKIDKLQSRYFSIVKRNNALLDIFGDEQCQQDLDELEALFSEVEKNIDKNNYYLQKYREIEKKYAQNSGETTIEVNDFASKHYEDVDNLLNEIYKEVRKKLPEQDFNQLKKSEIQWIKDVDSYQEVFEQQGFGTIGTLVKLGYEINMRNFRALLLMLYL